MSRSCWELMLGQRRLQLSFPTQQQYLPRCSSTSLKRMRAVIPTCCVQPWRQCNIWNGIYTDCRKSYLPRFFYSEEKPLCYWLFLSSSMWTFYSNNFLAMHFPISFLQLSHSVSDVDDSLFHIMNQGWQSILTPLTIRKPFRKKNKWPPLNFSKTTNWASQRCTFLFWSGSLRRWCFCSFGGGVYRCVLVYVFTYF